METIQLLVGSEVTGNSGITLDETRKVEFQGKQLARVRQASTSQGKVTDTRGTIETLYRAADGRLVVHVEQWSHWQGEPDVYTLQEVTQDDLATRYPRLADEAGLGCPLTLDEALAFGVELPEDYEE